MVRLDAGDAPHSRNYERQFSCASASSLADYPALGLAKLDRDMLGLPAKADEIGQKDSNCSYKHSRPLVHTTNKNHSGKKHCN